MQTPEQSINNPEQRPRYYKAFTSMRSQLTASKIKTIFLVSLISFTSLLIRQTLQGVDSILGLSLIVILVACGIFILPISNYKEAILWAAGLDYDQQNLTSFNMVNLGDYSF